MIINTLPDIKASLISITYPNALLEIYKNFHCIIKIKCIAYENISICSNSEEFHRDLYLLICLLF